MFKQSLVYLNIFLYVGLSAQNVTLTPANPTGEQSVTLTFNAAGTPLAGETKVYAHAGVVTTNTSTPGGGDWRFVKGNWGQDNGVGQMTAVAGQPNQWQLALNPSARSYFGVPAGTNIFWIAMVFRNADGSKQTSPDIFVRLSVPNFVEINSPVANQVFFSTGSAITFSATASASASSLTLAVNSGSGFNAIGTQTNVTTISGAFTPTASGLVTVKATAVIGSVTVESQREFTLTERATTVEAPVPIGLKNGINYSTDATKATLVLLAPGKEFVYVVGDFTNWQLNNSYLMKKSPDGKRFWLELTGLESGKEYVFQYWVDGVIRVGDPYAEKVADPWNDKFIPTTTYPNLPTYTREDYGIASVLQTNQAPYTWAATEAAWKAPDKKELVVYELLIRDFVQTRRYKELTDTLKYLKRLGVNAIELMPIMEFEGNESWGYNPSYFFAPDKYYGTKNDLKRFIEVAHQQGFAVILDMVLNHAFGQNPMVMMYFDRAAGKPTPNSPWFNPDATHPFNVGYDFNHESEYTKAFVDTVCSYWLKEYHFDGYRFDLSKGFTQTNNPSNVNAWSAYDQSRINLLTRMANKIWSYKPDAYVILEHLGVSTEERELANRGMLLWGKLTGLYSDALTANNLSADFNEASRLSHVNYMESHDEERVMVDMLTRGRQAPGYDVRDLNIALNRLKLAAAFLYPVPGPKMLWQFGELGYDKSINFCPNGSINPNCRVGNKPLPWGAGNLGYYENAERQKVYKSMAAILQLINRNKTAFKAGSFTWSSSGSWRFISISHSSMDIAIVGNFSTTYQEASGYYTKTGTWFDFFSGASVNVTDLLTRDLLAPGEFHIYTTVRQPALEPGLVNFVVTDVPDKAGFSSVVYPNPSNGKIWVRIPDSQLATEVQLLSTTGARISSEAAAPGQQDVYLDATTLPKGIYLIRVEGAHREVHKVVIH
jgi:hypothetical protein